ncbi:MAG: VanZ family protein [Bacteroidetes bacterium]|nr:VanZ family protein [Bacteroidota bacterium]
MPRRNRYLLPVLVVLLFFTLKPGGGEPIRFHLDKVIHFCMYLVLGLNLMFASREKSGIWLLWGAVLAILTEIAQSYIPGRGADLFDSLANTLGLVAAWLLYTRFRQPVEKGFKYLKA